MIPHGTAHDRATAIAGLAVALVVLVSCGAAAPAGPTAEPLDGTYTASGGGGALPAVQALTARFHELHPETTWIVSESGSNSAIKLVLSKTIDVGFVSRALTDLARTKPVLLILGDLDDADDIGLDLIKYLAHLAVRMPLLMVGALHDPDIAARSGLPSCFNCCRKASLFILKYHTK